MQLRSRINVWEESKERAEAGVYKRMLSAAACMTEDIEAVSIVLII